ncbi:Doublecortin domain-containing protein 2C [Geranomyces variabilis]|uniref:Doublecortin domain-containing protein 2C n=1 Tax=Geranomyces variabilis TaxID=109894 RepID=A0AAD5XN58_9FUNG|nr:Doublecortin domain-containing protein 2C [Geranomyces variabilis]
MSAIEERSKRIRVFRNGDIYDRGRRLVINPRVYRNFEQDLNLTNGAARRVFALTTGHPVASLDDLADNGIYIASAGDALKRIPYLVDPSAATGSQMQLPQHEPPGRRLWHGATVVPRRVFKQGVLEAGTSGEELRDREHTLFGPTSKAYKITVFHNGEASIPGVSSVLNYRNCRSFEQFLRHLTELLRGSVRKVYDAETGGRINNLRQVRDGQNIVVATSMAESFKRVPYLFPDGRRGIAEQDTPRVARFFPNGDALHTGQVVTITKKMFPTMQRLLDHLNAKIHMVTGTIHKIYSLTGQRQHTVDDLATGADYVVVSNNDAFIAVQYNINALGHLHRTSIINHDPSTTAVTRRIRKLRKRKKKNGDAAQAAEAADDSEDQGYQTDVTTSVVKRIVKKKKARAPTHEEEASAAQHKTTVETIDVPPRVSPAENVQYDDYHRRLPPASTAAIAAASSAANSSPAPATAVTLLVYGPQTREEAGWRPTPEPAPQVDVTSVAVKPPLATERQPQIQHHGNPPAAAVSTTAEKGADMSGFMKGTDMSGFMKGAKTPVETVELEKPLSRGANAKLQKEPPSPGENEEHEESHGFFTKGKKQTKQQKPEETTQQKTEEEESVGQGFFTKGKKLVETVRITDTESTWTAHSGGAPIADEAPFAQSTITFVKKSDTEGYFTKGSQKLAAPHLSPATSTTTSVVSKKKERDGQGGEVEEEVVSLPPGPEAAAGPADANEMYGESSVVRVLKSTHPVHGMSSYSSSPSATRRESVGENDDEEEEEVVEYETVTTKGPSKKTRSLLPGLPRRKTNA